MASIRKETVVAASADRAWDAVRDIGAIHRRLVPGFVTDCRLEGDTRLVTFANGMTARERIVTVDEAERRVVWTALGTRLTHHNGSLQVSAEGPDRCRLVWIADLLPDELAPFVAGMMDDGMAAMKRTLEK